MQITYAMSQYFAKVDEELDNFNMDPIGLRPEFVARFVKVCALQNQDPFDVANVIARTEACVDSSYDSVPSHLVDLCTQFDTFR